MASVVDPAADVPTRAGAEHPELIIPPAALERRGSGTATEQALALYRAIFANSTEAIAIIDPEGHYLEQNAAHERLIGYGDTELRDATPAIHLGDEQFAAIVRDLQETGTSRRECTCRTRDGRAILIQLAAFSVLGADGLPVCYVGIKRDVTSDRHAAIELSRKFNELQAIYRMVDAVSRADAIEDIYDTALEELIRTVRADRASVLLFDPDGVMRFKAWRGLSQEYRERVEGHSPWSRDERDAQPILVSDVHAAPDLAAYRSVFESEGIRALGFIPLLDNGQLLGKFMIYFDDVHRVAPAEVRVAQSIASHIALAITRVRSDTALRESEERYRKLVEHSPVAVCVHSEGKLVFINSAGAALLGAESPEQLIGRSVLEFVHPEYRSTVVDRMQAIAHGAVALPMIHEKFVRLDGRVIDAEVAAIGFTYQGKAASQIVATDITERRRAEEEQRLLAEAGTLLNSSLDYAETLRSITKLVVPSVADWCIIDLTDDEGGFDRIAAASADPAEEELSRRLLRHYAPLPNAGRGITRTFVTLNTELAEDIEPEVMQAVARDEDHADMLRQMAVRSYICVPMVARGRVLGVISFVNTKSGRRFRRADLPFHEELARRAALAVDNARLYRDAHEANRAKSQFLARMSHELRTPLNAIGGYAELLEMGLRGPVTDAQREDISRIQRSQRHLLGLINDLLSYAKIESGHIELNIEHVIVSDALNAVSPLIEPQAAAKGVVFEHVPGDASIVCVADHDKLRQIVLNLLSNAVKFTESGGRVALRSTASTDAVHISVTDTGVGVPVDKQEKIFEPFVQLAPPLHSVSEGAGLGLAICRELARAMGGDVAVESTGHDGATFSLTLPRA